MTLRVTITVPKDAGNYAAVVSQTGGNPDHKMLPGMSLDVWVHSGNQITVKETQLAESEDFPLGSPASLCGETVCESCQ